MRLLVITQKIDLDDAVLGFTHGWLDEFARQAESIVAICLEKGRVNLPKNVTVLSLGKEKEKNHESRITNQGVIKKIKYSWHLLRYIVTFRNEYDSVFVHMNPEYVVLGGIFWKWWGKTVTLWYAHKSITWYLRLAHLLTNIIFTSTASGFRLPSVKVKVIGQGIDVSKFQITNHKSQKKIDVFRIVTVGRITPAKDYDTLIEAIEIVGKNSDLKIHMDIFGPTAGASDEAYLNRLKEKVAQKALAGVIAFRGPVANNELPEVLAGYDLFVNMGQTGSLDKAVPEAMAVGLPVLTCNEAFKEVLGPFRGDLMYGKGDSKLLAGKIKKITELSADDRRMLGEELRAIVVRDHSLRSFVSKILFAIKFSKS